jgi:hypothetical protein
MRAIKSKQNGMFLAKKDWGMPYTTHVSAARKFRSEESAWKEATKNEKPVDLDRMRRKW